MKKIVIAPDSFKGTLSAEEVCQAIANAAKRVFPEATVETYPLADGGEGTAAAFAALPGSYTKTVLVKGPFGEPVKTSLTFLADGNAVVETAACAGLPMVRGREDPLNSTTYGLGEMILCAAKRGAKKIWIGLGGSCTNDAGAGATAAMGVLFYNEKGETFVPTGATLDQVARIERGALDSALTEVELILLCDVEAPLFGRSGAAYVFAPQKGAHPEEVRLLDHNLRAIGALFDSFLPGVSRFPGAGAAGGLGAGLMALANAKTSSGIDAVLEASGAKKAFQQADLILTGEGKLDRQSLSGKVISGVVKNAGKTPVIAIAGVVTCDEMTLRAAGIQASFGVHPHPVPIEKAAQNAAADLEDAAAKALLTIRTGWRQETR